jgi:hypothetical protein
LLKPDTNKDEFRLYSKFLEKSYRGSHHSEILKTNAKTLIYSNMDAPPGTLGVSKKVPLSN